MTFLPTPPTRRGAFLDLIATNLDSTLLEVQAKPPLCTNDGIESDHSVLHVNAEIPVEARFKWRTIQTRPITKAGEKKFRRLIIAEEWDDVMLEDCPSKMVNIFNKRLDEIVNYSFPLKTKKIKNTDDPWIDDNIRKEIKLRKRIYARYGRSNKWHEQKRKTNALIKESKRKYYNLYTNKAIMTPGDASLYYKVVSRLKDKQTPPPFNVSEMCPGKTDLQVAEELADYFSAYLTTSRR